MRVTGIDENGLGPLLGPLIATATTIEVKRYDADALRSVGVAAGVGDSKATSGFRKMRGAESIALAVAERELGRVPRHVDEFLEAISLDGPLALRAPCPDASTSRQCFETRIELPAFGGEVERGREALKALSKAKVKLIRTRTAIRCAGVLNAGFRDGVNKLKQDLAMFERLALDARRESGRDLEVICGMIGGIRKYPGYMTLLADRATPLVEEKGASSYAVDRLGVMRFVVDSDDGHLPVALASMVGKYVRELTMDRIVRFYRARDPELSRASGYHDKVTKRFVAGTKKHRRALGIVDDCFLRSG